MPQTWRDWLQLVADFLILLIGLVAVASLPMLPRGCPGAPAPQPPPGPPPGPQPPPAPPGQNPDPVQATVQQRFGSSGCSACLTNIKDQQGRVLVLTAAHCTGGPGSRGEVRLKDGRIYPVEVLVRQTRPDISVMLVNTTETLPYARLAAENAPAGTRIWHVGYGVDRPGNRESGTVTDPNTNEGQTQMRLAASSGDSGSPIFREDSGEQMSIVCCGSGQALWGANVQSIRSAIDQALKRSLDIPLFDWQPLPLPEKAARGNGVWADPDPWLALRPVRLPPRHPLTHPR